MLYVTSTARSDYRILTTLESFDNASFANPFFVPSMEVNRISPPSSVPLLLPNQINLIPLALCPYQMNNPSTVNLFINREPHIDCQISVPNH
jgi:hypothetical protein